MDLIVRIDDLLDSQCVFGLILACLIPIKAGEIRRQSVEKHSVVPGHSDSENESRSILLVCRILHFRVTTAFRWTGA